MLKIKDESGKVLFTATDESIEPIPATKCMECGCPAPTEEEITEGQQKEEKK